ncbi:MAG: bifunctional [glutamine synthetase] adenylyltransferase/[glutamine synthetase]-adenylyl-L-tyrosine phosphorylase [Alphaproteobacteria bacterium]|nr:bifunctional [glutamine synthetase] adenylyltransferase/[glutamine synthetase]-adenylyl-L-tyrosine phosphorylase [Alphaproteobacteria bacterium]
MSDLMSPADPVAPPPVPFDSARADSALSQLETAGAAPDGQARAVLRGAFGGSPFLTQCALAEPAITSAIIQTPPAEFTARVLSELARTPLDDRARLMRDLRVARRRIALTVALADIAGAWTLEQATAALSTLAEVTVGLAVRHLVGAAIAAGELAQKPGTDDPAAASGYVILAMGKLGARELNYSSDIDLIALYDLERVAYSGGDSPSHCFIRLTRELVRLLQDRTGDGYAFRTDLRLRPDAVATPIAVSVAAAESYYESVGQNWERAALIKARPIAGDIAAGEAFLSGLAPFIWRKHLDFAAIADIHSIKRQIAAHRGHDTIAIAGHNIKLGRGGIREIEFFAQTQQLIAGGRDARLRRPDTCGAIQALADTGRVAPSVAVELIAAYRFLRRVEHRLQMIADQQTHTIPRVPAELARLAVFLGFGGVDEFGTTLRAHLSTVEAHYAALFESAPPLGRPGNLVFTGTEDDPETLATLARMGFDEPSKVAGAVRVWHHGRYAATRSARARELLTELVPAILESLARTAAPTAALLRFDEFLAKLSAGVSLFALFRANPMLLDVVAEIMGSAPRLAEYLSRAPQLLDGVLGASFGEPLPDAAVLLHEVRESLAHARDYEDVLDIVRRWARERRFQVGVQLLRGGLDAGAAGSAWTAIADAAIQALLPAVADEFALRHGRVSGGELVIVGLGKLGGDEFSEASDLDLVFIYDCAGEAQSSGTKRPLPGALFYARLCQRLINAFTSHTAEGPLYRVDMRLRPSGSKGPIAVSLAGFFTYHRAEAWLWEHMALTRARVVAGDPALAVRTTAAIQDALCRPRSGPALVAAVADMRERIGREHGTADPWAIKHVRGGLLDVEFLCQWLQLGHAAEHPEVIDTRTDVALERLAKAGALSIALANDLAAAARFLRSVQVLLRLTVAGEFDEAAAPPGLKAILVRATGAHGFADLRARLLATEAAVHAHFRTLIAEPAAAARASRPEPPPRP